LAFFGLVDNRYATIDISESKNCFKNFVVREKLLKIKNKVKKLTS